MDPLDRLRACVGFDWDDGNADKNWIKHRVTRWEAEQVFFNQSLQVADDTMHSFEEDRYLAYGKTVAGRRLYIVFTIRENLIRVISARDMNIKEKKRYLLP